jgi:hypothetical protein
MLAVLRGAAAGPAPGGAIHIHRNSLCSWMSSSHSTYQPQNFSARTLPAFVQASVRHARTGRATSRKPAVIRAAVALSR